MAIKRRKAEKLPAAQSREEAITLLGRYAELAGRVEARNQRAEVAIAQMRTERDKLNEPEEAELKAIFLQIKPWWAVAAEEITDGNRKSWELGGCMIGHRTSTPSLGYSKPETVAIKLLLEQGWLGLLRVKYELDKPSIMTALKFLPVPTANEPQEQDEAAAAHQQLLSWGFSIVQKEEFFIDRIPPKDEAVAVIVDPQALQVAA